jgi:hypothetical protein
MPRFTLLSGFSNGTRFASTWAEAFCEVLMRYGAVLLLLGLVAAVGAQEPATDPMRHMFLQRVDEYVGLHRRLEGPLPREVVTADASALFESKRALAAAIRAARADAQQGDIFSPAMARYFQILVSDALKTGGVENLLAIVEEDNDVHIPAAVNVDYPAGRSISMMPACLLAALPALPPELEYRFVGRDLILWDVHAGLIIDFVPNAIRETT